MPTNFGGVSGVIDFLILEDDIPALLPVHLLETLNTKINLNNDIIELELEGKTVKNRMTRLDSGLHLLVCLLVLQGNCLVPALSAKLAPQPDPGRGHHGL